MANSISGYDCRDESNALRRYASLAVKRSRRDHQRATKQARLDYVRAFTE